MVKQRPGSRKGLTKLHASIRKAHRRKAQQKPLVVSKHLRETWDRRLTPAQNLFAAGLRPHVNELQKTHKKEKKVVVVPINKQVLEGMEADASRGERVKRIIRPGERAALDGMVKKYGTDYSSMSKDLKMNYLQWTAQQLRRKIERMQEALDGEE